MMALQNAKRWRTPPELQDRIAQLRERNWSKARIAAEVGLSVGAVGYWCLIKGAEASKPSRVHAPRAGAFWRNGRPVHPFTDADDAMLVELDRQGLSYSAIARALTQQDPERPRKSNTVRLRLATLARHEAIAEAATCRLPPHGEVRLR